MHLPIFIDGHDSHDRLGVTVTGYEHHSGT